MHLSSPPHFRFSLLNYYIKSVEIRNLSPYENNIWCTFSFLFAYVFQLFWVRHLRACPLKVIKNLSYSSRDVCNWSVNDEYKSAHVCKIIFLLWRSWLVRWNFLKFHSKNFASTQILVHIPRLQYSFPLFYVSNFCNWSSDIRSKASRILQENLLLLQLPPHVLPICCMDGTSTLCYFQCNLWECFI